MVGVNLEKAVMAGADTHGALDDKPQGRPRAELGVPVEEAFRLYRLWVETGGRQGRLFDFSRLDLRGIGPRPGLVLTGASLEGVILQGLNLEGASLQGTKLVGADLRDCNLAGADLRGANQIGRAHV